MIGGNPGHRYESGRTLAIYSVVRAWHFQLQCGFFVAVPAR